MFCLLSWHLIFVQEAFVEHVSTTSTVSDTASRARKEGHSLLSKDLQPATTEINTRNVNYLKKISMFMVSVVCFGSR